MSRPPGLPANVPLIIAAALILGAAVAHAAPAASSPPSSSASPATLDLAPYAGRVVIVDFWASWCAPCKASLPWLQTLDETYKDQGLTVLLVNVDRDRKAAEAMLAKEGITLPVTWDPEGKIAAAYRLEGMPSSYLYGRDGKLRDSHLGFDPRRTDELERGVTALLAEKPKPGEARESGT